MQHKKEKIHFIAIGGSVMHNLAVALKQAGHEISGSDDEIFDPSRATLIKHGLLPDKEGWHPEKLDHSFDAVILGMHAKKDNPELLKAQATWTSKYFPFRNTFMINQKINSALLSLAVMEKLQLPQS